VAFDNNVTIPLVVSPIPPTNNPVTIAGNVTVLGGLNTGTTDRIDSNTAVTIGGNTYINFNTGAGGSAVRLLGTYAGGSFTFVGGPGNDFVQCDGSGSQAHLTALLGPGADTFTQ
jgi:hypothetical protein